MLLFAAVGVIGIASQWLAWRFRLPAIIFLLCAGLIAGPVTGLLQPTKTLGPMVPPLIGLAVAIILFEGGLSLDFRGLRGASVAVRRLTLIASPLSWILIAAAAHVVGHLSWPTAAVIGGILIVTGPTVVQPLLQTARIHPRPSAILRWEAIVNDPIGALFAVLAYEVFIQTLSGTPTIAVALRLLGLTAVAGGIGFAIGMLLAYAFRSIHVPEYLKVPTLFVLVIAAYVAGNGLLDEAGLLTVMVMGVTLGNSRIASIKEIRRFKEHAAVLLVSGVFVLLTSNADPAMMRAWTWHDTAFVGVILLVVRPCAIVLSTLGVGNHLTWREILLISWVAPRGVVAVATGAVFGAALPVHGAPDGEKLPMLVLVTVITTVLVFGLSTGIVARSLKLASSASPGLMIVGCNEWTIALAGALAALEIPVLIADRSWRALKAARESAIPIYYGEILAEAAEHRIDYALFGQVIAATDSHSYNTLVCTDLGPQFGRQHVFQVGRLESEELDPEDIALALGGRTLMNAGYDLDALISRFQKGWTFRKTKLTEEFNYAAYEQTLRADAQVLLATTPGGTVTFATTGTGFNVVSGQTVLAFVPPEST